MQLAELWTKRHLFLIDTFEQYTNTKFQIFKQKVLKIWI